jgi:hypothetical protein
LLIAMTMQGRKPAPDQLPVAMMYFTPKIISVVAGIYPGAFFICRKAYLINRTPLRVTGPGALSSRPNPMLKQLPEPAYGPFSGQVRPDA